MKKTKDQFRIKNLKTDTYVKNGNMYHWASLENAISAIRQRCNRYRYFDDFDKDSTTDDFEIERYELVKTETINPTTIIKEMEIEEGKQSQFYKSKQEHINQIYDAIKKVASIPDMKVKDIKKMLDAGVLNQTMARKLIELFEEVEELESTKYTKEA
jgi:hypothetical protein